MLRLPGGVPGRPGRPGRRRSGRLEWPRPAARGIALAYNDARGRLGDLSSWPAPAGWSSKSSGRDPNIVR
jgi:hypothetical protein